MDDLIMGIISEYQWTNLIKKVNREYHRNYYLGMCLGDPVLKCSQCHFFYNYRRHIFRFHNEYVFKFHNECWVGSVWGHQCYPSHKYKGFRGDLPKNY